MSAFTSESTSVYISAVSSDINLISEFYLSTIISLAYLPISIILALVMMFNYNVALTIASVLLLIIPLIFSALGANKLAKKQRTLSKDREVYVDSIRDIFSGFPVIKSFQAEDAVFNQFEEVDQIQEDSRYELNILGYTIFNVSRYSTMIIQNLVLLIGAGIAIYYGNISPGAVIAFYSLLRILLTNVQSVPESLGQIKSNQELLHKLHENLELNIDSSRLANSHTLSGSIIYDDVSFSYDSEKLALNHVDFKFDTGKSYAIVGASGSGKSTALKLLMSPQLDYQGSIRIGDQELSDTSPESIYQHISIIQQNVFIFNSSILNNITMFQDYTDKEIRNAIDKSGLRDVIKTKGLDYECGQNGKNLSGGEKQRIAIARTLLLDNSVILVDEATSSLDMETASLINQSILALDGYTKVVVTHRLERRVLEKFDLIYVLKEGEIIEEGIFAELMEEKGYFYSLYTVAH